MATRTIVVAFSGGLDTTFCVVWLRRELDAQVHTVFVDSGGADAAALARIAARATAAGAVSHTAVDGRAEIFDRFVRVLVQGNVLRGGVYPLCVGAERVVQAERMVAVARRVGADAVCHGSTGAGNDQVRFDVAFHVLAPDLEVLTPVRDLRWSRQQEADYLAAAGLAVDASTTTYSVNAGLWGTTIGGGEVHDTWAAPSSDAWAAAEVGHGPVPEPRECVIGFEAGVPVHLDGERCDGVTLCERLTALAAPYRIGRGIHVGETILGIKGRIAFVAAAAAVLIPAHRELEKLVMTRWQSFWKDQLATWWGDQLHGAEYYEPAMRDVEALITSSQSRVTGEVRVRLRADGVDPCGARSPFTLEARDVATYGEQPRLITGADARGLARIKSVPGMLWRRAGEEDTPAP